MQRTLWLNIAGAIKMTPSRAMEAILNLTPSDIYKEVVLMTMITFHTVDIDPNAVSGAARRRHEKKW